MNLLSNQFWVLVENSNHPKALCLKGEVLDQRHTKIARTQQDNLSALVQSQNISNLLIQSIHIVAVALLTTAAKAVEVLPNLRSGQVHQLRQLP